MISTGAGRPVGTRTRVEPANNHERGGGAVSAPMAIAVITLLAAIGLGIDGSRAAQALATADAVAEEAARAGGQALDTAALRRGEIAVDPAGAVAAALAHLAVAQTADAGVDGSVTLVGPQRIRVQTRASPDRRCCSG